MRKIFANLGLVCALSVGLVMGVIVSADAQAPAPTPVPTATLQPVVQASNPNVVAFTTLGQSEIQLTSPFDTASFSFALPADWKLTTGAALNLAMSVSFSATGQVASSTPAPVLNSLTTSGGTLSVSFNAVQLGVIQLNQVGEVQENLTIPSNALISPNPDGRMVLTLTLDSSYACNVNQETIVSIHTSSQFLLPHESVALTPSLANFPQPIYQGSFVPDSAVIVVPDQPSSTDLQEAMTVAAGLGNVSGNTLLLDMTTASQLTADQKSANHLILVGKAASQPILLRQLQLPVPASQFQATGSAPDDGLIEMINSPWSANHVILVVSGNTDQGALKAAQAVTAGHLLTDRFPNVSVVQNIQTVPVAAPQPVDRTIADMGYPSQLFANFGLGAVSYQFYIPPGSTVAPDAHFDLVFGNSELLDYGRSGIVVSLNNIPIGSVRMSDATATQATNTVEISIPSSAILPGNNVLTVRANLIPINDCTPRSLQGLWVEVWSNSSFHLPLTQVLLNPVSNLDLSNYPAPFIYDPMLSNTAFVLSPNDLNSWRAALHIAAYLGQSANGTLTAFSVDYSDQVPNADRAKYNLLVIGLPSQSHIVSQMNSSLPVPFSSGDNLPAINSSQVTYSISPDSPLGYIEMMPSPWNPNNIVLAVLGNSRMGLNWATAALIDPTLRSTLAGNFDVINDRQILTTNTRVSSVLPGVSVPTLQPAVQLPLASGGSPSASAERPSWILPLIATVVVLIVVILIVFLIGRRQSRNRMGKPRKDD